MAAPRLWSWPAAPSRREPSRPWNLTTLQSVLLHPHTRATPICLLQDSVLERGRDQRKPAPHKTHNYLKLLPTSQQEKTLITGGKAPLRSHQAHKQVAGGSTHVAVCNVWG